MKILVTGAAGFVGKNLVFELRNRGFGEILEYDRDSPEHLLEDYASECGFVFHLAGVNRTEDEKEFMGVNLGLTRKLIGYLGKRGEKPPFLFSSSSQAVLGNPYGRSKKAAEYEVFEYGREAPVYVYRLANIFGKWSRPGYNSVVATFCHNTARGLPVRVDDAGAELELCYVDDVLDEFARALSGNPSREGDFCAVPGVHRVKLGYVKGLIDEFREKRSGCSVPDLGDEFTRKLYSTYVSFLPADGVSSFLKTHSDGKGAFSEFLRLGGMGQVSLNFIKPGVEKGNHWHRSKTEKFLVVSGKALIRLRRVDSSSVVAYSVSGARLESVEIPPGHTHTIRNVSEEELAVVIWASEVFKPEKPDTYPMEL